MAGDDTQMNSAMGGAQATLPAFLGNATDEGGFGVQGAAVKVAFATSDGSEIIWVTPFAWDGDISLTGLLVNQPVDMGKINEGDQVDFSTDMVRDWSYTSDDGMLWGNYTTRVVLRQLDQKSAAEFSAVLPAGPVPPEWQ